MVIGGAERDTEADPAILKGRGPSRICQLWLGYILFCSFPDTSPGVLTFLFRSFCLGLYGSSLWSLSSGALSALEITFNKVLRRIWKLPYNSHTRIVQCSAKLQSLFNLIFHRSSALYKSLRLVPLTWSNIYSTNLLIVVRFQFEIWQSIL